MRKEILITFAIASLLLITPLTVIAQENKMSSNLIEQPDIAGLIAQIRTFVNEIQEKYGHNPMVRNLSNMILNLLELIGNMIICIFLLIILIPLVILLLILDMMGVVEEVWLFLAQIVFVIYFIINTECRSNSLCESLYTLSETRDITNLSKGCPCLQE